MRNLYPALLLCVSIGSSPEHRCGIEAAEDNPRFRIPQLEIRLPESDTYPVPANINAFRLERRFTVEHIRFLYDDLCRKLTIKPFQFEPGSDVYRELYRMQLAQLQGTQQEGYRDAVATFLAEVDAQLGENNDVRQKFRELFGSAPPYTTCAWDVVSSRLSAGRQAMSANELAGLISSLESYRKLYAASPLLKPADWAHPAFLFYRLDYYKQRQAPALTAIRSELEARNPQAVSQLDVVLSAYDEAAAWLHRVCLFFLEERWFLDERSKRYMSMKEMLEEFWQPLIGSVPTIRPRIIRRGEVDATGQDTAPFMEYPQLLQPLNSPAEDFLKQASPLRISAVFGSLGEWLPKVKADTLPKGAEVAPLGQFIYDLRLIDAGRQRFTEAYDVGCPVTMLISNMPHEIAHSYYAIARRHWKREYSPAGWIYFQYISNYVNEGIAEACQVKSVEQLLNKFPILRYDNLLKHCILGSRDTGNHHTWGWLWLGTALSILNDDFGRLFSMASAPAITLEELMRSPEFQTPAVVSASKDTSPVSFDRQRRRRALPSRYVFPSTVVELDGDHLIVR
jgi:hypothetical protein